MEIVLKLENFEGPLDLLLDLIDKKEMSIAEIQISELIEDYLAVIEETKKANLEVKSEFAVLASELLVMKALSLLKIEEAEEKEAELRTRLQEHQLFKELGSQLSLFEHEYNISYSRGEGKKQIKRIQKDYDLLHFGVEDLYRVYQNYAQKLEEEQSEYMELSLEKKYNLKDEMERLFLLIFQKNYSFEELFQDAENRMHLIYIFLAVLELYKDGKIEIEEEGVRRCSKVH